MLLDKGYYPFPKVLRDIFGLIPRFVYLFPSNLTFLVAGLDILFSLHGVLI